MQFIPVVAIRNQP